MTRLYCVHQDQYLKDKLKATLKQFQKFIDDTRWMEITSAAKAKENEKFNKFHNKIAHLLELGGERIPSDDKTLNSFAEALSSRDVMVEQRMVNQEIGKEAHWHVFALEMEYFDKIINNMIKDKYK